MKFLHKYGSLILLFVRIAILIAVPFLVADSLASHTLVNADTVKYLDGDLYGIETTEYGQYLFRHSVKNGYGRVVKEHGILDMTFSNDGKIYLLRTENGQSEILEWNKKGNVKTITKVADVEDMHARRIMAANNGVFYIYYANESGTETQRFGYNSEWKPVGAVELSYNEGFELGTAKITDSGSVYFVSDNGSIYMAQEKAEPKLIFDVNNGPEDNCAYANYRFMPYSVSFSNLKSGNFYSISTTAEDFTPSSVNRTYKAAKTFDDTEMHNAAYTGDTIKAGVLCLSEGGRGAAVCGDVETTVGCIKWSPLQYVVTLLLVAAVLVLLYLLLRKLIRRLEDRMLSSDMSILLSASVILMVICLVVSNAVLIDYLRIHQNKTARTTTMELADAIVGQLSELDVAALAETGETPIADTYAEYGVIMIFFEVRDGEIYYASKDKNPEVPVNKSDPGMGTHVCDAILKAVDSGEISDCFFEKEKSRYSSVVVPMGDLFGETSAMVVGLPMTEFWTEYFTEILAIALMNLVMLAAVFATILVVLKKVARQMNSLMDASARVLAGELGAQADPSGINEVAATIRIFNRMSARLKREEISLANCEIMTKSFTPLGLMRQINGGFGDTVVKVGSEVQGKAQVLGIVVLQNGLPINQEVKEKGYKAVSRFVEALSNQGGSIMDVTFFSLRYVDAEMTRDLFRVIAPIIREMNMSGEFTVKAALHVTDIRATVVGTEDYMILDVYETKPQGTKELLEEAHAKDISFVLTDFAAKIAGLNRYHFRKVGLFHASPTGRGELLYEALDACTQKDARKRWNSTRVFEEGLKEYYFGNLPEARRAMAEVLIEDTEDTVARYYLKACEGYKEEKPGSALFPEVENTGDEIKDDAETETKDTIETETKDNTGE